MTTGNIINAIEGEKKYVKESMGQVLRETDQWFILDREWFESWKLYVDFDNKFGGSRSVEVSPAVYFIYFLVNLVLTVEYLLL